MLRKKKRLQPDVAITHNEVESQAMLDGFEKIRAYELIGPEDVVVITPNWVNKKKEHAKSATIVGPHTLQILIQYVKKQNPKRIIIATGSGSTKTDEVMKDVGYDKIIQEEGVEFIDINKGPYRELPLNYEIFPSTKINELVDTMTVLISFTQLKHHEEATMSATIKNMALGWPPAEVHGYPKKDLGIHTRLHDFIRAMAEQVPIDLAILSASPAMIGSGPTNGLARHTGLVVCGTDAVAVDTVGARLLGFKSQGVNYLFQCGQKHIGEVNVDKMNISGLTLKEAEEIFSKEAYGQSVIID